jgi:nitrite reductase/ring-hydroxylating ferredoxin subunit
MDRGEVRRVTVGVRDLARARRLYSGLLGMREIGSWRIEAAAVAGEAHASRLAVGLGLTEPVAIEAVDLEQPGTSVGAVRLVRVGDGSGERINEGARAYDHGYVKNLDFFTDDVRGEYLRFVEAGFEFLAPPVEYAVPWGRGAVATEAHLPTEDGVKISLAKMAGVPRIAMGRSARETPFTEVAAATQIVKDFGRSERFYCDVLDLVPAAPTVIEGELIAALHLPEGTRLRMSFLSGREAAGGRVGIVSYEGRGVEDARDLKARVRAPHRGILGLTFAVEDVEYVTRKALALGATLRCAPAAQTLPGSTSFDSTVVSPDGIPLHFEAATAAPPSVFSAACRIDELPPGSIRDHRPADGSPRVAIANVAGEIFAFEDRCPHLGAPLSRGEMRGRTLVCPWHGWMIDVPTGEVGGGRGATVRRCAARVRDGQVEVAALARSGA